MDFTKNCDLYRDELLTSLKELVAIPSLENLAEAKENEPFGKEVRRALDYMLNLAKKDGFDVIDYDGYAGLISYGEGNESVGILGHLDIVPLGEGWTHDPLGCEIVDGYIFGRGVEDDKGPTLSAYYALKMLKDHHIKLNKRILLIVGCNEETGMKCMDYYKEHGIIPDCGFSPDADFPLVYGEKGHVTFKLHTSSHTKIQSMHAGERPNIVIGRASAKIDKMDASQKNLFAYYLKTNGIEGSIKEYDTYDEIEIIGKYFHAARSYNGNNAALHILNFVGSTFDDELSKDLYSLLKDWKGEPLNIAIEGNVMGFLTLNVGIVDIENDACDVTVDIRYPIDVEFEDVLNNIKESISKKTTKLEIIDLHNAKPLYVDPKSKFITTLENSYRKYSKDYETPLLMIGGGTYAKKFDNFVAYGAVFPISDKPDFYVGGAHEKDEGIKIDELMMAMAIYADAIYELGK